MSLHYYCAVLSLLLLSCNTQAQKQAKHTTAKSPEPQASTTASTTLGARFFNPSKATLQAVDSVYHSLSNKERAAQMIMTASSPAPNLGYPFSKAKQMLSSGVAANVVFLKGTAAGFKSEAQQLNALPSNIQKLAPLFACDCEPTLMPNKWSDVKGIIPAADQKTEQEVAANAQIINKAMKMAGVQLNFAPVVDIAINKSVINKRSFGSDPQFISAFSKQFVSTTQAAGIGATLKHFPGHGAISGDSHKQSVYIDGELTELNTFKQILEASEKPVAVMLGHIIIKNNPQYQTNGLPASISRKIATDLLRHKLNYKGIITTDALNMEAAAKFADADWKAVEAGVDLILMPKNAITLNQKIATALETKTAISAQIEASVKRIILLKLLTAQP
jgi:beta-N-acetylhexosaminidase